MMKNVFAVAIIFIATYIAAIAGKEPATVKFAKATGIFSFAPAPKSDIALGIDARYNRTVTLRPAAASSLFFSPEKTLVISDFPVGVNQYGSVQLRRASQITDAQTLWMLNDQFRPGPKAVTYMGFIQNEEGSSVRLCLVNNRMYGIITRADGSTSMLAPESSYDVASGLHVIASDDDPRYAEMWKNFRCDADEVAQIIPDSENKPFAMPLTTDLLEVEVGVEVDVPIFNKFLKDAGNDFDKAYEMTEAYMYAIFAMSSSIYENEINVMLTVSFVKIWSDYKESGYPKYNTFGADGSAMLQKEAEVWGKISNKTGGYKRDLFHMVTSYQGSGLYTAGIAYSGPNYSGTICLQDAGYGLSTLQYGQQMPVISFAWDVEVISHEMGHNFRSPHTHNCMGNVWPDNKPLDTCVNKSSIEDACYGASVKPRIPWDKGTIMSYCHLLSSQNGTVLEFRPIVADVIRDGAERAVARGCVTPPEKAVIKMQYPLGRNTLSGGRTDTIRWTSSKVNTVRVEYSDNNGQSWTQIGEDVAAGTRKMPWLVPSKGSNQYLVRVTDPTNIAVGDSSWVTFTVKASSLALQYPTGGERIGQNQKPSITWTASLVDEVKIEFSPDGGNQWSVVAPSTTGNSFAWSVPNVTTDNAIIRVSSATDGSVVSQSQNFSIGKEVLRMLNRPNLDTLCRSKTWKLSWESDFILPNATVMLYISDDDGATWDRITNALGVRLTDGIFENWAVPASLKLTENGRIRIAQRQNELVGDTMTTVIMDCSFTSVFDSWSNEERPTLAVAPNPTHGEFTLNVIIPKACNNVEFYVADGVGRKVAALGNFDNIPAGKHSLHFDATEIAQGAYFITMQSGAKIISTPIRIAK
ncbi:MAG: hypothetical protein IT283_09030 [Bacteroidetes bacterium]|nr:hypothetical protein [Bacteroidota bacterium]